MMFYFFILEFHQQNSEQYLGNQQWTIFCNISTQSPQYEQSSVTFTDTQHLDGFLQTRTINVAILSRGRNWYIISLLGVFCCRLFILIKFCNYIIDM